MATYGIWDFTDKDIDALANILDARNAGIPIDMRRVSKTVRQYLKAWDIVTKKNRRWVVTRNINYVYEVPVQVVFKLLQPALEAHSGYSINKNRVWEALNIYPAGSHHETQRDINERVELLARLHTEGLINFLGAGSVWRIEITRAA